MRWFKEKQTNYRSSLIPYKLYAVNERIYDEIVKKEDGNYYLIRRCGIKPATLHHGEVEFVTDGKRIIYPLPVTDIEEIKLDWIPPKLLGEFTRLGLTSKTEPIMEAMAKVDRRYIDDRKIVKDKQFEIDLETLNTNVPMFIKQIYGTANGIGTLKSDGKHYIGVQIYDNLLPKRQIEICIGDNQLRENDYIKWNDSSNKYQLFSNGDIVDIDINKIEIILEETENRIATIEDYNIDLYIPTRILRPLTPPTDVSVYNKGLKKGVKWEHVPGAEQYEVYLNDVLLETTEYNGYVSDEEFEGFMKVRALNELSQSEFTEPFYIKSIPNEPFQAHLENYIEAGEHVFQISFADYSELEDNFRIKYSVDGKPEELVELEASPGVGTIRSHIIRVPVVEKSFRVCVTAINEIGETEVVEPITRYIIDRPRWMYNKQSQQVLIDWVHQIEGIVRYKVIMEKDNGEKFDDYVPVDVAVGANMRYTADLGPDEKIKVSIVPVDSSGNSHIHTKPVEMSMNLDKNLIAPTVIHNKISDVEHEFIWDDIYTVEREFEIVYSISNGPIIRDIVKSDTQHTVGRKYRYKFDFAEHGFMTIKIRMNWDLGSSEYSEPITIYHVPASGLPPEYIHRQRVGDNVNITWQGQEYVKNYELLIRKGIEEDKIVVLPNNTYTYPLTIKESYSPSPLQPHELNTWKLVRYPDTNAAGNYPSKDWVHGLEPIDERIVQDTNIKINTNHGDRYVGIYTTNIYVEEEILIKTNIRADDRATVILNNKEIVSGVTSATWLPCNFNFRPGWNKIEVILLDITGSDFFIFENDFHLSEHEAVKKMTHEDRFLKASNDRMEFRVRTNFLNGVTSEYSKPIIFTPDASAFTTLGVNITKTVYEKPVHTTNITPKVVKNYDVVTKSSTLAKTEYTLDTRIISRYTSIEGRLAAEIKGVGTKMETPIFSNITLKNSKQFVGVYNQIIKKQDEAFVPIGTYIRTMINQPYPVHTEINKVTIVCIGDSITSGHPGWWAETGTGDIRSQYEYWLDIRLKGQFTIINKGYGSDTTDDILARFDKDVLGYHAQYCIIQGGTNDLYWAMAEASGDKSYLDAKVEQMKNNIIQMVKRCWENGITPIVGTLIPRTGATGIYKDALYEYNEWIINYCTGHDNIFYIDFFNAGKDKIPPTPLEDPANPGALNPKYDGDAIYDEYGNLIKQGRGIHPNWEGYRIMAESIPLNIFKTGETGLKLYLDAACTIEEKFNNDDKVNPFYRIDIDGIRRGVPKKLIRYVKNVGNNQNLFVAYSYDNYNIDVKFLDANGRRMDYANGLLPASAVARIEMVFDVYDKDSKASVNLYLASREFKVG